MPYKVKFNVKVETQSDEVVCVVGNCLELGEWNHEGAVMMENDPKASSNLWSKSIELKGVDTIEYRFFVGRLLEYDDHKFKMTIIKWETHDNPRSLVLNGPIKLPTEVFGMYEGVIRVAKGWLIGQTCIQLRIHGNAIKMWKTKYEGQKYCIKCVPMDYRPHSVTSFGCQEDTNAKTLLSVLDESNCVPSIQEMYGKVFNIGDYFVFRVHCFYPSHLGFKLEFFVYSPNLASYAVPKFIGFAHLLPLHQTVSLQLGLQLPIMGLKHKPIGEVLVDSLIIKPHPTFRGLMDKTYQSHWKMKGKTLDVGHRGMGMSHKNIALVRENTLSSFNAAASHGADMIEFDVMLTRDQIPVIFHNYTVCLSLSYKRAAEQHSALFTIPIKDLTLRNLHSVKLSHFSIAESFSELQDVSTDHREPFPTLKQVLVNIDMSLDFNIEVKHPLIVECGMSEQEHYFDHNLQVDKILETVFEYAGSRQIVFSSFEPDTCIMLQLKQNLYPVLFLSNGPTVRYKPYRDFRAKTFDAALSFAVCEGILGVDFQAEGVLRDLSLIKKAHDCGLIIFIWGEDANDQKTIKLLRHHGADGIIYDRIDFNRPENSGVFELNNSQGLIEEEEEEEEKEVISRIIS